LISLERARVQGFTTMTKLVAALVVVVVALVDVVVRMITMMVFHCYDSIGQHQREPQCHLLARLRRHLVVVLVVELLPLAPSTSTHTRLVHNLYQ